MGRAALSNEELALEPLTIELALEPLTIPVTAKCPEPETPRPHL